MLYFERDCLPRCLRSGVMPGGNHAINSDLIVGILAKKRMFEDGEYITVGDICCGGLNQKCCPNDKCYAEPDDLDKWLTCEDGKCVKCGGLNQKCCLNDKCKPKWGLAKLTCEDGYCGKEGDKKDTSHCDKIQDQYKRDDCYYNAAVEKKDPSICDKIECPYSRAYCYEEVKNI